MEVVSPFLTVNLDPRGFQLSFRGLAGGQFFQFFGKHPAGMIEFLCSFFFPEGIFWGVRSFFRKFAEYPLPVLLMDFSSFTRDFF